MRRNHFLACLLCLGIAISVGAVVAQTTTGTISGSVADSSNAVLPGTSVLVRNSATGIERPALSDDSGRYRISNLPVGDYEVSASLEGFQKSVRTGITLTIGREAVVNFTLQIGQVSEEVTVTGEAPLISTTSASLGDVVDQQTVMELPLNGRDLNSLLTLQAGTTGSRNSSNGSNTGFSQKVSVSGARPHDNSILLDGTQVNVLDPGAPTGMSGSFVGAEAVREFKVERNAYSAEFGGTGGGVVNVVSKSGTNAFHGSVYEFLRNDNLDAANFRDASVVDSSGRFAGKQTPEFKRNQFGFSVGGPIVRNKTFFFGNYEGMRERLGSTSFFTTLTPEARTGRLQNPTTGLFTQVPVSPEVIPYLALWPLPGPGSVDLRDGTARVATSQRQTTNEDFYQVRVDHQFSPTDSFFVRYTNQDADRDFPEAISRWFHKNFAYSKFATLEHGHIFSPQLLATFRFGFARRGIGERSGEDPPVDPSLLFVPRSAWRFPLGAEPILGSIGVTGVTGIGLGRGWVERLSNNFQYSADSGYHKGSHSLKFGMTWQRNQFNGTNPSRPGGEFNFGSIADFLQARPTEFRGDVLPGINDVRGLRFNIVGWFFQDDWQPTSRLTLNLGFRHEFYTVPVEVNGKLANLKNPHVDGPAQLHIGDPWFLNPSLKSFMPRVGIAWDPTGSGKMAIRAGGGMFYSNVTNEDFRQALWRTAPFGLEHRIQATPTRPLPFRTIFNAIVTEGLGQPDEHLFPYDYGRNSHTVMWNVNIQKELFSQTALTVGYAGSRGLNLFKQVNLNTAKAEVVNGRYVFAANARVPNPAWDLRLTSREQSADSWYNSLQVGLQRRFTAGFQTQVSYTWSKAMDDAAAVNTDFNTENAIVAYWWDPDMRKSLSPFDVRHNFVTSAIWELPFGSGRRFGSSWTGLVNGLLGGWQAGGIFSRAGGAPTNISVTIRTVINALNVGNDSPDLAPGASNNPVLGSPDKWFDPTAFIAAPARTLGNLGRNTVIAPGVTNLDLSLTKKTRVGEKTSIEFRGEFFNFLNHTNLGNPARNVLNANGNRVASAGFIDGTSTTARQIQFGLRFVF